MTAAIGAGKVNGNNLPRGIMGAMITSKKLLALIALVALAVTSSWDCFIYDRSEP